eukprot:4542454-Pyramimonas_sp.AAC.1
MNSTALSPPGSTTLSETLQSIGVSANCSFPTSYHTVPAKPVLTPPSLVPPPLSNTMMRAQRTI